MNASCCMFKKERARHCHSHLHSATWPREVALIRFDKYRIGGALQWREIPSKVETARQYYSLYRAIFRCAKARTVGIAMCVCASRRREDLSAPQASIRQRIHKSRSRRELRRSESSAFACNFVHAAAAERKLSKPRSQIQRCSSAFSSNYKRKYQMHGQKHMSPTHSKRATGKRHCTDHVALVHFSVITVISILKKRREKPNAMRDRIGARITAPRTWT